jgi:hypothetical protein
MRRFVIVTGMAAGCVLGLVAPARADGWGSATCAQNPTAACDIAAGTSPGHAGAGNQPGGSGIGAASGEDPFPCRTVPVDNGPPPDGKPTGSGGWFLVLCSADGKNHTGPVWIPAGESPPVLSPAQVAEMARQRLRLPVPTIAANPAGLQLVNLPTWMWLSTGWNRVSATASVPGVSVTATASPSTVSWSMGDGSTVTCAGAGTPFHTGTDPMATSPDCGHTYRTSSARQPGHAFPVAATIHWTITWAGGGQGGTFPDLTTTGNAAFRVAESQALNNGGG